MSNVLLQLVTYKILSVSATKEGRRGTTDVSSCSLHPRSVQQPTAPLPSLTNPTSRGQCVFYPSFSQTTSSHILLRQIEHYQRIPDSALTEPPLLNLFCSQGKHR